MPARRLQLLGNDGARNKSNCGCADWPFVCSFFSAIRRDDAHGKLPHRNSHWRSSGIDYCRRCLGRSRHHRPNKHRGSADTSRIVLRQMLSAHQGLVLQVRDPSGAVLPGAAVSIVNAKTGQHWDLTTDSNGGLALLDLPEGSYELTVTASGFSSFVEKNLTVPGRVAITLQIGALMGEVVIVTGVGTEPTSSETPAALAEPLSANPDVPLKPSDHRNALQKFFAKLHRAF